VQTKQLSFATEIKKLKETLAGKGAVESTIQEQLVLLQVSPLFLLFPRPCLFANAHGDGIADSANRIPDSNRATPSIDIHPSASLINTKFSTCGSTMVHPTP